MKTICAWCNKIIEKDHDDNLEVSHGICKKCYNDEIKKLHNSGTAKKREGDPCFRLLLLLAIMAIIGFGVLAAFGWPILVEAVENFDFLATF